MPYPFQQNLDRTRYASPGKDNPIAPGDSDPQLQLQPGGASSDECDHKEVEQGEVYYGREEHQYTTYWFCADCGEELE